MNTKKQSTEYYIIANKHGEFWSEEGQDWYGEPCLYKSLYEAKKRAEELMDEQEYDDNYLFVTKVTFSTQYHLKITKSVQWEEKS